MCIRNTCVLEVVTVVLEVSENHHIFTLIFSGLVVENSLRMREIPGSISQQSYTFHQQIFSDFFYLRIVTLLVSGSDFDFKLSIISGIKRGSDEQL